MAEPRWERALQKALKCLGRTEFDLEMDRKGSPWKVALARQLRERYLVPNLWLSVRLKMGTANSMSSLISRHKLAKNNSDQSWIKLKNQEYVD